MNPINLDNVNLISPYTVWLQGDALRFKTDYDILYMVSFDREFGIKFCNAYWFNLANISNKKSPNDKKIAQTVACIIEGFFYSNPDILLYMCDSANEQQAQRERLFLHWFDKYSINGQYVIRTACIVDEGQENYVSMIIQSTNPLKNEITEFFDNQMSLFRDNK